LDTALLTGRTERFLCSPGEAERLGALVHGEVVAPYFQLREAASQAGFELEILSGFRSFERQLTIWNRKARGELPVLDSLAEPLEISRLDDRELVFAILRWSALPGASRHHWGTDLDVFDAAARPPGYEIELVPQEVESGGMFAPLHEWLDERMERSEAFGFFRPYDLDRGGVAPERWHLSHGPVAAPLLEAMSAEILGEVVGGAEMELKEAVLDGLEEIYSRFVLNIGRQGW
jgi:LAS superfamily LD-carboxypeptidase LdcB